MSAAKPHRERERRSAAIRPEYATGAELLRRVRAELKRIADPRKAPAMQRYMKSELPYHGVPMPALRATCRRLFAALAFEDERAWQDAVLAVWSGARFREELYVALVLTGLRAARAFQRPDAMPLYERLTVEGAWWDVVDEVAVHRVGPIVRGHPAVMKRSMRRWSRDDDMWKRRKREALKNVLRSGLIAAIP